MYNSDPGSGKDESIDPTDFLETGSFDPDGADSSSAEIINPGTEAENNSPAVSVALVEPQDPDDTEMEEDPKTTKIARRRCAICSLTVSSFRRHLKTAHAQHYKGCESDPAEFRKAFQSFSHAVPPCEEEEDLEEEEIAGEEDEEEEDMLDGKSSSI